MREYNVKELPMESVFPTGEIGVEYVEKRWERNGQHLLCPLCKMILRKQPASSNWITAAALSVGWTVERTLAFKLALGNAKITGKTNETRKGITDANLYRLLHKLARKVHR